MHLYIEIPLPGAPTALLGPVPSPGAPRRKAQPAAMGSFAAEHLPDADCERAVPPSVFTGVPVSAVAGFG
jgi:hypothetical protein